MLPALRRRVVRGLRSVSVRPYRSTYQSSDRGEIALVYCLRQTRARIALDSRPHVGLKMIGAALTLLASKRGDNPWTRVPQCDRPASRSVAASRPAPADSRWLPTGSPRGCVQLCREARERHVDHRRAQLRHEGAGHGDRNDLPDAGTEPVGFTATARRRAVVTVVVRPGGYVVDAIPQSSISLAFVTRPPH
jgi:hypothetical protein